MERVDLIKGDIIDGQYRVLKLLGEGSFGQVFQVQDNSAGNIVALKLLKMWCLPPDEREGLMKRFDREYATGKINSPYLVHSLGKGTYRGNPYIVMEFCGGGNLQQAIERRQVDLVKVSVQVLHGLKALHNEGKVHRDLKPENVLLRDDGVAVLTDFGISGDRNHRLTRFGMFGTPKEIMGTFIYMPPEQIRPPSGTATILPTTDIFSFGVMFYQMLTGELPFGPLEKDEDMTKYSNNGRSGKWDRGKIRSLPKGQMWLNVLEGCLEPNYRKRLQTIDDVLRLMPNIDEVNVSRIKTSGEGVPHEGLWKLVVMQGEEIGRQYTLQDKGNHSVLHMGRKDDSVINDIPIVENESSYISRAHCTLEWDEDEAHWYLWDGQWTEATGGGQWKPSLNGTYVGSRQATMDEPIKLHAGDIIAIGDVTLRME